MIDASQAKAETWLNDEYELNPKIRDVREHGAQARRSSFLRMPSAVRPSHHASDTHLTRWTRV